jgi:dihydrofolate reductase
MVISWVDQAPEGDAHFPEVDWTQWREVTRDEFDGWARSTYRRV